ncbi:MAG: UvrD-helicase domain-containing protein, partial [bacterium]|nr:UvrD-helicase domain-containing protein [bacterium]
MNLLSALNERQREAVEATDGPLLIVAGAGTGKTMVLTTRIAYLIQAKRVDPAQILAVTFTNKAAGEMKERIQSLLGSSDYQRGAVPAMGTFHSICVKILRQDIQHLGYESSFVIYDSDDSLALIKRVMRELQIPEKNFNPKAIRGAISAAKNVLQTVEDVQKSAFDAFQSKVGLVYGAYQKELKKLAALDFDDLIMKTVELFQQHEKILQKYQNRWKYLHIDEYQDTNAAQYRLIQLLASVFRNLCVVGDPDQNIYSWRGADITNILNFSREYSEARVVKLEQNYRSTPHILAGAQAVIARNGSRIEKNLWTAQVDGEKVQLIDVDDERAEAEYVIRHASRRLGRLRDQVVLYRTNAQSRVLEEACLRAGIPYKVIGGVKFYARKEIRDMVAYLRLVHNFRDDASLLRVINTPSRKIGSKTLEAVQEQAHRHGVSLFQVMAEQSGTLSLDLPETKMESLRKFCRLIDDLRESAREFSVSTLIREILHRSAY